MTNGTATQIVAASWAFGSGRIFCTTVPIDYYLGGNGMSAEANNMRNIFFPNTIFAFAGPAPVAQNVAVPTLAPAALFALLGLLALGAFVALRQRR